MLIQCKDMCEHYKPRGWAKIYDPVCKHFTGNCKDRVQLSKCEKYCSLKRSKNS